VVAARRALLAFAGARGVYQGERPPGPPEVRARPARRVTVPCAVGAIRAGLRHKNPAVREGCCRLLDQLVDTESMDELITMVHDADARVRIAAFHALACDRCKGDTCAPGPDRVLEPALQHLVSDPCPQVRMMAAELVGKFAHSDARAAAALETSHANDPSPAVRKKAGWFTPGGPIYERTVPPAPRDGDRPLASGPRTFRRVSASAPGDPGGAL
jgi:hypothetical protein